MPKTLFHQYKCVKEWAFHSKLSRKISSVFLLFMILSVLLTFFLYQYVSTGYALSNMEQYSRQTLISVNSNITEMIDNADNTYRLMLKAGIAKLTHMPLTLETRKYYDNYLFTLVDTFNHLDGIYITDFDNHLYGMDKFGNKSLAVSSIKDAPWYQDALMAKGSYILSYNAGDIFKHNYLEDFISVIRVINDLETQKPVGFAILNIPIRSLNMLFDTVFEKHRTSVLLYDEALQQICTSGVSENSAQVSQMLLNELSESQLFSSKNQRHYLTAGLYLPEYRWKLIADFPLENKTTLSGTLFRISLWVIVINIVLMFFCSIIISKSISNPITRLIQAMRRVKDGHLEPVEVLHPYSEIGILELNYNHMTVEIQSLLSKLVKEQHLKRKMELMALQEQIKPHFLYNTLDAIGYMALTDKPESVYKAIETLGSFYRQSLSNGAPMITIFEEIQIVRDYAALLSLRYESLFDVTYELDETALTCKIPRLILQPLVENAVYHGIKPLGEPGHITISVYTEGSFIHISVADNGIGIEKELIDRLLSRTPPEKKDSFGLVGTIERIRISYPENTSVSIRSTTGKGTKISFQIPSKFAIIKEK